MPPRGGRSGDEESFVAGSYQASCQSSRRPPE